MATDMEIAEKMKDWLKASGCICGSRYASSQEVARGTIYGLSPSETLQSLEPKIRRIAATPGYGFKVYDGDQISASDPQCGRG